MGEVQEVQNDGKTIASKLIKGDIINVGVTYAFCDLNH